VDAQEVRLGCVGVLHDGTYAVHLLPLVGLSLFYLHPKRDSGSVNPKTPESLKQKTTAFFPNEKDLRVPFCMLVFTYGVFLQHI